MMLVFNKNKILKIYIVVLIYVIKLKYVFELLKVLYIVIYEKL